MAMLFGGKTLSAFPDTERTVELKAFHKAEKVQASDTTIYHNAS